MSEKLDWLSCNESRCDISIVASRQRKPKTHLETPSSVLKLDASITLEKVVAIGLEITKVGQLVGTPGGRRVFEATVNIGGKPTTVRAVLNTEGTLRSVHIRK